MEYVDWFAVRDPHPMGLENLQKIADALSKSRAMDAHSAISLREISKATDIADSQLRNLLVGKPRPGFVLVRTKFGTRVFLLPEYTTYPTSYVMHRGTKTVQKMDYAGEGVGEGVGDAEPTVESNGDKPNAKDAAAIFKAAEVTVTQKFEKQLAEAGIYPADMPQRVLAEITWEKLAPKVVDQRDSITTQMTDHSITSLTAWMLAKVFIDRARELEKNNA